MHLLFVPVLLLLLIAAYHSTLQWMFSRYISPDSYFSHGFIVPFVAGYFIWNSRNQLQTVKVVPSLLGLIIIFFAILLHILGTVLYIFSISGFSIYFFIIGFVLFIFGKEIGRVISFPILFLIFMFPVPLAFILSISYPLKKIVTQSGVLIIRMIGIPVYNEGFHIFIPAGELLVGNPCSGLRSLISFMALGSVMAHISELSLRRKWLIFGMSIPVAILSNVIRVLMLIMISNIWGLEAAAPDTIWHSTTGIFVFLMGLVTMYFLSRMLKCKK